jgi:integrase-like protein
VVVTNGSGRIAQRNSFGDRWRAAVKAANLPPGTRFHDLRHFYASALIAANLNPKVIQARLGHASITETMDTYGHLFPIPKSSAGAPSKPPWLVLWRNCDGTRPSDDRDMQVSRGAAGESACRPGSVHPRQRAGGHPSRAAVAGSLVRSTREHRAGHPLAQAAPSEERHGPCDLAPGGVYRAARIAPGAGGLLHHRFTLAPARPEPGWGGLFSVALSRGSPRVGVTDHLALWSPDLPHRVTAVMTRRGRPAGSPAVHPRIDAR